MADAVLKECIFSQW